MPTPILRRPASIRAALAGALAATILAGAALAVTTERAAADPYRWCAQYGGRSGATNCYFRTLQQCRAAISGNGGFCTPNPFYTGEGRRPRYWHY